MAYKISVVMPVFNEEKTLRRSMDSILQQTFTNFELIIINEAATGDGSVEIIKTYMKKDNRIKLLQKTTEPKGVAVSLNLGLRAAKGEYIARMDADDYSYPLRFEKQVEYLDSHPDVVLCGTQYNIKTPKAEQSTDFPCMPEDIKAALFFSNVIGHPTVMFRRAEFVENQLFYNEKCPAEDYELWFRVIEKYKIANMHETLVDYYTGFGNNITLNNKDTFDRLTLDIIRQNFLKRLKLDITVYDKRIMYFVNDLSFTGNNVIKDIFLFLRAIERQNSLLKFFDVSALNRIICNHWNQGLQRLYISTSNVQSKIYLPQLKPSVDKTFEENLVSIIHSDVEKYIDNAMIEVRRIANGLKKIIVFGTGIMCMRYFCRQSVNDIEVLAFVDNHREDKDFFLDRVLISPQNIHNFKYDAVLVATNRYYNEICEQLINECQVSANKVFPLAILSYKDRA